jgi:hypothetical protein
MLSTETIHELLKKNIQLPYNNRSGEGETARSLREVYIYRLKRLQQRMSLIFQILVGFSQLLLRYSHGGCIKLKTIIHIIICW